MVSDRFDFIGERECSHADNIRILSSCSWAVYYNVQEGMSGKMRPAALETNSTIQLEWQVTYMTHRKNTRGMDLDG